MQQVELKPKNVVGYMALPGLLPRLKTLFGSLNYLPFFLAQIYRNLGLLRENHPYLMPENQGRYGVVSLVSAASHELSWDTKNIDRIILFGATILALVLFVLFGVGLVISIVSGHASALTTAVITDFPQDDIAFEILDRVFGVPGVFDSGYAAAIGAPFPNPFHTGLHSLLEFYNTGLLIIAGFIFAYYIVSIVAETAITGVLFGNRFHKIWGPLRLIIAIGLLIPFGNYGLNSAQYILLYVAKFGSGLATNTWIALNSTSNIISPFGASATVGYQGAPHAYTDNNGNPYAEPPIYSTGNNYQSNGLIIHPSTPDVTGVAAHIDMIYTCMYAYKKMYNFNVRPWLVKTESGVGIAQEAVPPGIPIDPTAAVNFYNNKDIRVYFGYRDTTNDKLAGGVNPVCGEMVFKYQAESFVELEQIRWLYYWVVMIRFLNANLDNVTAGIPGWQSQSFGHKIVAHNIGSDQAALPNVPASVQPCDHGNIYPVIGPCNDPDIAVNHRAYIASQLQRDLNLVLDITVSNFIGGNPNNFSPANTDILRGWAAAGIWYNKISEWNGGIVSSVSSVPYIGKFPDVLEKAKKLKLATNPKASGADLFTTQIDGTDDVDFNNAERAIHKALLASYNYWNSDASKDVSKGNPFETSLATIFGLTPIMTVREQDHVHPLAQLAAIGSNLIENAIANLGLAYSSSFVGGVMNAAQEGTGAAYTGLSGFFVSLSFVGILLGFTLYYIIPFMPFLYSFFAVSGWVKSIFEAMVGVPLWALAHLKLKGDGLVSREAMSGYFLLLEIFIRPTLIIFGLVAMSTIFAALVTVLNSIWDLVTSNMTGINVSSDPSTLSHYRNSVDQFFFLVLYVITVYMIGTSCFKMVDMIPQSVTRWINAGVKSFGDMAKDPAEGLGRYASMAAWKFGPEAGKAASGAGEMTGRLVGKD